MSEPVGGLSPHVALKSVMWFDQLGELGVGLLVQAMWDGGMPYHRRAEITGAVPDPMALLPKEAVLRHDSREGTNRSIVVALPDMLVRVSIEHRLTTLDVVGADVTAVEALLAELEKEAQRVTAAPEGHVRMRFWSYGEDGAGGGARRVATPTWSEVTGNYAQRTRTSLASLMSARDMADRAGRLILWHGVPGTGKTTAVRALAGEWSSWCRTHYVMDPERLFAEPQYLLTVAGADEDEEMDIDDGRWRLVVAEDCDEYLRSDAKVRVGASLGRLLNLCDGILGHGLKVLVLLTTNEDIGRLHPAITRPGRCLSQVEFQALSPAESQTWLARTGAAPERPMTLAELYALKDERAEQTDFRPEAIGGYL